MSRRLGLLLGLLGLLGAALAQPQLAALRFANFAGVEATLTVAGAALAQQPPGGVSDYLLVPSDGGALELRLTDDSGAGPLTLEPATGAFYTVAALPHQGEAEEDGLVRLLALRDALEAPRAGGTALRLVNVSGAPLTLRAQPGDRVEAPAEGESGALGWLRVRPVPAESRVVVVGPDGFSASFSGASTLAELAPGRYVVSAAQAGYESAAAQVEVAAGQLETLELRLRPLPGTPTDGGMPDAVPDDRWTETVAPGASSLYAHLAAGAYDLSLVGEDGAALAELKGLELELGASYSLFVYRDPGGALAAALSLDQLVAQQPPP